MADARLPNDVKLAVGQIKAQLRQVANTINKRLNTGEMPDCAIRAELVANGITLYSAYPHDPHPGVPIIWLYECGYRDVGFTFMVYPRLQRPPLVELGETCRVHRPFEVIEDYHW